MGGVREDLSPHLAPPGTLRVARNVRFPVASEARARRGTTALSIATAAGVSYADVLADDGPDFLAPCPGGFVFGCQGYGFRYDFAKGRVHVAGSYSHAVPVRRFATVASEECDYDLGDSVPWPLSVAVGGGYVAICWSSGNGVQSINAASGADNVKVRIYTEGGALVTTWTNGGYTTACVVYDPSGSQFVIVAQEAASGSPTNIAAAVVTLSSSGATVGAFSSVGTLPATASCWAACTWPGIGWALIYQVAGNAAAVKKCSGVSWTASQTFAVANADSPLSIFCDETHVYVGWVDVGVNSVAKARVYDTSVVLTSGGAVTLVTDVAGASLTLTPPLFGTSVDAATAFAVVGRATDVTGAEIPSTWLRAMSLTAAGSLTIVNSLTYNMLPVSSPFGDGLVWCRYRTPNSDDHGNNYTRHVLLDFMCARVEPGDDYWRLRYPRIALAGEPFADPAAGDYRGGAALLHMFHPQQLSGGTWIAPIPRLVRSEQAAGSIAEGLALAEWLEFAVNTRRVGRTIAGETIVAGSPALLGLAGGMGTTAYMPASLSVPSAAGQMQGVDLGFFFEPAIDIGIPSNGSGALTAGGTYYARSVIEWIDSSGRRWRSRASRIQEFDAAAMAGNDTITFTSADDYAWLRQHAGDVAGASSIVKHYYRTTNGGDRFYRATPPQGVPLAGAGAVFVDTLSDGQLASREFLYTDGGVLDNDHAPSCQHLAITEDRAWFGGLWDGKQIASSKILVPGEPYQCSDSPTMRVVLPDDCTGLAAQDGSLVAFAKQAVYAVQGAGPTDQGQGAWDSPRVVTRSTGCVNGLSVLETSAGIFFESARGLELLPRGLGNPQFIGAGIQNSFGAGGVTGCAVIESTESRTARFCNGTTQVFVFDLDTGAWSVDEYPLPVTAICDTERGAVLALASDADGFGFLLEDEDAEGDAEGSPAESEIECELEWADQRPFGIAGWGQFDSVVGLFAPQGGGYGDGNGAITMSVDGASDTSDPFEFSNLSASGPSYREHIPAAKMGTALTLGLSTTGIGWRFMGWTVGVQQEPGVRRTPEEERA